MSVGENACAVVSALTIAGSDSGGGAGIQADLKSFCARGVFGTSALTAITAQNTRGVTAIQTVDGAVVTAQIEAILDDIPPSALKIGMLGGAEAITTVATALNGYSGIIVLDPVMIAKSGDPLLPEDAIDVLREKLLPRATVLTPNLPEAARLLDKAEANNLEEIIAQGEALLKTGPSAVLMKGGHATGPLCRDVLVTPDAAPLVLDQPRIATRNTHGTGCSLSACLTAELAKGYDLPTAVKIAQEWLHRAIFHADSLNIGQGNGPVHHFHGIWPETGTQTA